MFNVQWMVDEIVKQKMDQEESYNRQQMAEEGILFEDSSSSLVESDHFLNRVEFQGMSTLSSSDSKRNVNSVNTCMLCARNLQQCYFLCMISYV